MDIIAVQNEDGTIHSSPFHVRFGSLKILKAKEKNVILLYLFRLNYM
jgi:phosphatidate phosphatase PAH1